MKNIFFTGLAALGLCALALNAPAALPTFKTFSANGNAAGPAYVYMPADPNSQIRVVSLFYSSDTNKGSITFSTGAGAYYQAQTNNATSSVTNAINSTNGLLAGDIIILQQGGIGYTSSVSSYGNTGTSTLNGGQTGSATNVNYVVLGSGGWGVAAAVNSDIYEMSLTTSTLFTGAQTNAINGDAIFVGNYGRPVLAQFNLALITNQINSLSVHYDSASQ